MGIVCHQWTSLRGILLGLSGLGQMASPVQAVWMCSHFTQVAQEFSGVHAVLPEVALGNLFHELFGEVSKTHPAIAKHPKFLQYVDNIWAVLAPSASDQLMPSPVPRQEQTNTQRLGRQDPSLGGGCCWGF